LTIITGFTGIDQAYETPENPDLIVKTIGRSVQDSVMEVIDLLERNVSIIWPRIKRKTTIFN